MKKGLINMIAMVLTLVNLILTGLLVFAIVPAMQSTNSVVTKIGEIIDLDAVTKVAGDSDSVPVDQLAVHTIEEKLTITLADDKSGTPHYAVVYASIYFDTNNEEYATLITEESKVTQEPMMKAYIDEVLSTYTADELNGPDAAKNRDKAVKEIKDKLNKMYGTDVVYEVVLRMTIS